MEITNQELFWQGEFGDEYISRNNSDKLLESNRNLFEKILAHTADIESILELGCNIGLNLEAIKSLKPELQLSGVEINVKAADIAQQLGIGPIYRTTILKDMDVPNKYDLTFTKGVLIHINPGKLSEAYENLVNYSKKYILICEYYNPQPVSIPYRGHNDKLFKRDFANELIKTFDLELIEYGFVYHGDNSYPQDDLTWFLLKKKFN